MKAGIFNGESEDSHPDLLVERGPHGHGVGRWVPDEKHLYLKRYLNATREARKKFQQRVLIDPFCGPGRIQVEGESFTRDGGSVAAYRETAASGSPFTQVLVGDIEADRSFANELRLTAAGASAQSFHGPAIQTVDAMIKSVPFGKHLHFGTLRCRLGGSVHPIGRRQHSPDGPESYRFLYFWLFSLNPWQFLGLHQDRN